MKKQHTIIASLTTAANLHVACSVSGQREKTIDGNKKIKYSPTTSMAIPMTVSRKGEGDILEDRDQMENVPVLNANLIRGRLRRNIAARMLESLRQREQPISADFLHLITSLATSASPNSVRNFTNALKHSDPIAWLSTAKPVEGKDIDSTKGYKLDYLVMQTADPFTALFGGGPNMWPSRLMTTNFLPNITTLNLPYLLNDTISHHFEPLPSASFGPYGIKQLVGTVRGDDLAVNIAYFLDDGTLQADAGLAMMVDSQGNAALTDEEKKDNASGKGKTKDKGGKLNIRNMMAVEVVAPGVEFIGQFKVKGDDVDDETFDIMQGLVLLGLEDFATTPIGSFSRNGFGCVSPTIAEGDNAELKDKALAYIDSLDPAKLMEAYGVVFK